MFLRLFPVQQVSPRVAHTHTTFVNSLLKNFDIEIQLMERIRNLNIHFFVVVLKLLDIIQPPFKTNKMCIEYARLFHNSVSVVCCGGSMHTCVCATHYSTWPPDRQSARSWTSPRPKWDWQLITCLVAAATSSSSSFPAGVCRFGIRTRPQQERSKTKREIEVCCANIHYCYWRLRWVVYTQD
jgi:hypothetical protein